MTKDQVSALLALLDNPEVLAIAQAKLNQGKGKSAKTAKQSAPKTATLVVDKLPSWAKDDFKPSVGLVLEDKPTDAQKDALTEADCAYWPTYHGKNQRSWHPTSGFVKGVKTMALDTEKFGRTDWESLSAELGITITNLDEIFPAAVKAASKRRNRQHA